MTSYLLYTLAQLGFKIDILQYGMNVIMDVINLAVEISDRDKDEEFLDVSSHAVDYMEG